MFLNTAFTGVGDSSGLVGSGSAGNLYFSLHTAEPVDGTGLGYQNTNEISYTGYARAAVPRTSSYWSRSGNVVTLQQDIYFPISTGGSPTATYVGLGTASSGAGTLLWYDDVTSVVCSTGVRPWVYAFIVVEV